MNVVEMTVATARVKLIEFSEVHILYDKSITSYTFVVVQLGHSNNEYVMY